jgi:hypothetical protein
MKAVPHVQTRKPTRPAAPAAPRPHPAPGPPRPATRTPGPVTPVDRPLGESPALSVLLMVVPMLPAAPPASAAAAWPAAEACAGGGRLGTSGREPVRRAAAAECWPAYWLSPAAPRSSRRRGTSTTPIRARRAGSHASPGRRTHALERVRPTPARGPARQPLPRRSVPRTRCGGRAHGAKRHSAREQPVPRRLGRQLHGVPQPDGAQLAGGDHGLRAAGHAVHAALVRLHRDLGERRARAKSRDAWLTARAPSSR